MGPWTVGRRKALESGNRFLPASHLTVSATLQNRIPPVKLAWFETYRLLRCRKPLCRPPGGNQGLPEGKITKRGVGFERNSPLHYGNLGLRIIFVAESSIVLSLVNVGPEITRVTSHIRLQRGN